MADLTIDVDTRAAVNAVNDLKSAITGLVTLAAFDAFAKFADSITNLNNKLIALNPNLDETNKQFKAIAAIAISARAPLESVGDLFAKISRNADYLGLSQRQAANITETLAKMLALSGMSASEASGPLLQFGQALAAGKFQGDELRSILEGFPALAQAIADKLGVSTGALKKLGSDGKISALDVIAALEQVAPKVEEAFGRTAPTISQAFEVLKTSSKIAFDEFDKNAKVTESVSRAIISIAADIRSFKVSVDNVVETLSTFFKILVVIGSFTLVGRLFRLLEAGAVAVVAAFEAVGSATTSLAANLWVVTEAIAKLYAGFVSLEIVQKVIGYFKGTTEAVSETNNEVKDAKDELSDAANKAKAIADAAEELRKKMALFKFETGKTVENYEEMVRKSLQARNNVVDLQMAQGKLTDISQNQFEIEDGINKFLDQRSGILQSLQQQVEKVKLDQALKIGDPKENAGKLKILRDAIKEVHDSSQVYTQGLKNTIEKEQELRRLQFIRANDIKVFQAEVELARDLATALSAIGDAESAAEKASLGRIEALRKGNDLADARYRLDKALIGVNQIDADLLKKTFDLYQKQNDAIEAVGRTANLTAEARANEEKRIREETQKSIDLAVEQAADAKARQQDFGAGWSEAFRKYAEDATDANKRGAESFQFFSRSVEDAFVNLTHGIKSAVKSLVNSIVVELARIAARQSIAAASGLGGGGGLLASVGKFLGFGGGGGGSPTMDFQGGGAIPGFAAGGSVMANKPIMVGERGPEMFLPNTAGSIIPNNQLTGPGATNNTNVTYNINAVDASSFRSLVARDPAFIFNITEVGRRSTPQRSV